MKRDDISLSIKQRGRSVQHDKEEMWGNTLYSAAWELGNEPCVTKVVLSTA